MLVLRPLYFLFAEPYALVTVVLGAGIASEENVAWLKSKHKEYKYLVVSRKRTLAADQVDRRDASGGVLLAQQSDRGQDGNTLWRTYTLLTDLEAVFRCLKSELGLRPIFHHKTCRVSSHLFICVLAYHLVHTIRSQLKSCGIDLSWEGIRRVMAPQQRVTTQLKRADGRTLHIRKSTRAEHAQQEIYDALGISNRPGRIEKVIL